MPIHWDQLTRDQRDQVTVDWDGMEVPYQRILDAATKLNTTPDVVERMATPQGKIMARAAHTTVGRGFLRAANGMQDIAFTGLDIAAKAGLAPEGFQENLQANRANQESFNEFITRGGPTEEMLGPVGARVFDNAIRSTAKFAVPGGAGLRGTAALGTIYGMAAAESGNDAHNQALSAGMDEREALVYAAGRATIDASVMFLTGRFASSIGAKTLEEGLSPGLRVAASRVLNKNGVGDDLASVAKTIAAGATAETVEEGTQDALGQIMEIGQGFRDEFDWQQMLESAATGFVAAGGTQSISKIAESLSPVAEKIKGLQPQIENAAIGVLAAESFIPQATSEQIESVLQTTGVKDLQEAMPGVQIKNAQQAEAVREEVKRQAAELQQDASIVSEVAAKPGQDVSLRGVPEPQNAKEAVAVASGAMTARTYQELRDAATKYGQDGYYSPGRTAQALVDAEVRKQGLHTKENTTRIAEEVIANPNTLDMYKQEAMKIRGAEVDEAIVNLQTQIGRAETPGQIANTMAEISALQEEGLRLVNAMQLGGTPAAQLLALRRTGQTAQYGPVGVIASATTAKKAALTQAERAEFTKDAVELQNISKAVEAVEVAVWEERAMKGLQESNNEQASEDIMSIYERINTLLNSGCDL